MDQQLFDATVDEMIRLRWNKSFHEALSLYKAQLLPNTFKNDIAANPVLIGIVCDCLRETGQSAKAVSFVCNYLDLAASHPKTLSDQKLLINLSWLFFFALNTGSKGVANLTQKHIDFSIYLVSLLHQSKAEQLFAMLLFRLTDYLLAANQVNWQKLNEIVKSYTDYPFSKVEKMVTFSIKGKEKTEAMASQHEKWTMLQIRILYNTKAIETCIASCRETLHGGIDTFHHGNQVWVARYLAKCLLETGQTQESILLFGQMVQKKRDWFLLKELGECYLAAGKKAEAFQALLKAFLQQGHSSYKVSLYEMLGRFADIDKEIAEAGICLAIAVRKQNQWKYAISLAEQCKTKYPEQAEKIYDEMVVRVKNILNQNESLEEVWMDTGKISRILHEGDNGDGFITSESGKTIYFRMNQAKFGAENLMIGTAVYFKAKRSNVGKNERWQAIKIVLSK